MGYTVAVDTQGVMQGHMQRAGVSGIPHAFVVDRSGHIAYRCARQHDSLQHPQQWRGRNSPEAARGSSSEHVSAEPFFGHISSHTALA